MVETVGVTGPVPVTIAAVALDRGESQPLILLAGPRAARWLAIPAGDGAAERVAAGLAGHPVPPPPSIDLVAGLIESLDARVVGVILTFGADGSLAARVDVVSAGVIRSVEGRPDEAIAFAAKFSAPVSATPGVLERLGITHPAGAGDGLRFPAGLAGRDLVPYRAASGAGAGEFASVEWPQLNWLREPVERVPGSRVFADARGGGSSEVVTWTDGMARRNEILDAPFAPSGRAYPLRHVFERNAWPVLFVWFDPSQRWERARGVTLDAGIPPDLAPARPLTFRVILEGLEGKYDTLGGVDLRPGWSTYRFPLAVPRWIWRGKGPRLREIEEGPVNLDRLGPVNAMSIMLEGWNRTESGTVWFDRLQLV